MANVGFFSRLGNLWRGFVSLWIADVEKKHPEIAYENAINSMIEKYAKLKQATSAIIRRRDDINARLKSATGELKQVEADLNTAVATDQRELGLILLQKKKTLADLVAELSAESQTAMKEADSAKSSLIQVQSEIKKLKAEKDQMMAKMASAQVRIRIQEQLEGLSVDAEVKALENVRENIKDQVAQANLGQELGENDLDNRLNALRQQSGAVTAQVEWDQLRQASAAKTQKTM
jgi:phage shock protein A